jgi:hypothetical protein
LNCLIHPAKTTSLYELNADYTIVAFWDPTCSHCKGSIAPSWILFTGPNGKQPGLKIFTVAKETDGTKKDWMDFINAQHLQDWTNVYYSKTDDKARSMQGIRGIRSFTMSLLSRHYICWTKKKGS